MTTDAPPKVFEGRPSFVGRERELSWLREQFATADHGTPRFAFVAGEPGIGKTAMVRHFLAEADAAGWQTVWGRCSPEASAVYLPFFDGLVPQLVRAGLLGADDSLRSLGEDVQSLGSELAARTIQLAARRALVFVIDDLQFGDQATLALTVNFVRRISEAGRQGPVRLLLIATHHPAFAGDPLAVALDSLRSEPAAALLELSGLDEFELFELVQALTSLHCAPQLLQSLLATTKGNPLSAMEVLRALEQGGRLSAAHGHLAAAGRVTEWRNPRSTPLLLADRIGRLDPAALAILQTAAVLGEVFDIDAVAGFHPRRETEDAVDEGVLRGLLQEDGAAFRFSHGMIRRAILDSIGPNRLRNLHRSVAEQLIARFGVAPESSLEIAGHVEAAGTWPDTRAAGEIYERAADFAMDHFVWGSGLRFYEDALGLDGYVDGLELTKRGSLLARAARATTNSGDVTGSRAKFREALDCYRGGSDLEGWGLALLGWWRTFTSLGIVPPDDGEFEEFARAANGECVEVQAQLLTSRAEALWIARRPEDDPVGSRAYRLAATTTDAQTRTYAATVLALIRNRHLQVDDAIGLFREAIEASQSIENPRVRGWALARLALPLILKGDLSGARAACAAARTVAEAGHDTSNGPLNLAVYHAVAILSGDLELARRLRHEGGLLGGRAMYPQAGFLLDSAVAWERLLRGEYQEADDAAAGWERVVSRHTARPFRLLIAARSGERRTVLEELSSHPIDFRPAEVDFTDIGCIAVAIELADELHSRELAEATLLLLGPAVESGVVFSASPPILLPRVAAAAARVQGDIARANRYLALAQAAVSATNAPIEAGLVSFERARLLHFIGEPVSQIGAAAVAAAESFRRHDLLGALVELRGFLNDAGLAGRLPAVAAVEHELSATESDVLQALATGIDRDAIGDQLLINRRTVDSHLERIGRRLGVHTAEEANHFLESIGRQGRTGASQPAELAELTAREREVLGLIAKGMTNQQIADELVISLHTAIRHVANILGKTGAANRTEAARLART